MFCSRQVRVRALRRLLCIALIAALFAPIDMSAQSVSRSSFDHFTTGFELDGAHRFADCESCHTDGMFVGAPTECAGCHTNSGRVRAATKPAKHALSSQNCAACHRNSSWVPIVRMDHVEAFGQCADCHNGRKFAGKPVDHIPATNFCEDCHNTSTWSMVTRVDHLQVLGTCSSCHNGVIATGQHAPHIPTVAECDSCHNTTSWRP